MARPSGPQPDHSPLENAERFPHLTAESDQQHHAAISFFGGLIQAGSGNFGGLGRPFEKRSGSLVSG